ncbi:MAG: 30S ribosomal protein THX [Blastocatellia bacterium]
MRAFTTSTFQKIIGGTFKMGRGDQRSKRGKISRGTSGKSRKNPKQLEKARKAKRMAAKSNA